MSSFQLFQLAVPSGHAFVSTCYSPLVNLLACKSSLFLFMPLENSRQMASFETAQKRERKKEERPAVFNFSATELNVRPITSSRNRTLRATEPPQRAPSHPPVPQATRQEGVGSQKAGYYGTTTWCCISYVSTDNLFLRNVESSLPV